MSFDDLFAGWEARTLAAGYTLADLRKQAGVHAANFSNWRNGKGGMTLASIKRVEAAIAELEATPVAICGVCERSASDPVCDACTRTDCGLRQKDAA